MVYEDDWNDVHDDRESDILADYVSDDVSLEDYSSESWEYVSDLAELPSILYDYVWV